MYQHQQALHDAVTYVLRQFFINQFEVPYVWTHKRDYLYVFDVNDPRSSTELLGCSELWRVYALGEKYRALANRRKALESSYLKLSVSDDYYEVEIKPRLDTPEQVSDASEWLAMKYKNKKKANLDFHFHDDDDEQNGALKTRKMPSRVSAYEVAKKTIVSKLAEVRLPAACFHPTELLQIGTRAASSRHCSQFPSFTTDSFC
jgi:transcription elongation factor SPT6